MNIKYRHITAITKNYRAMTFSWFLILIVITILIGKTPLFSSSPYLAGVFFIVIFPWLFIALSLYRKSIIRKIDDLLYGQCDPESYLKIYGYIAGYLHDADINTDLAVSDLDPGFGLYWLKITRGIIETGDTGSALEILTGFKFRDIDRKSRLYNIILQSQYCIAYLNVNDPQKATVHLQSLLSLLEKGRISKPALSEYESLSRLLQIRLDMAQGNFTDAERFFGEMFGKAENNYERVSAKFYLGEIYLHNGGQTRAKEALEYVISNGNKLHIVEESKEKLFLIA